MSMPFLSSDADDLRPEYPVIKVLDHGHVRLVESMGNDLSIVRNARVSYNASWRAGEDEGSDTRLINYLMKNRHSTPFESVVLTFDIKAPIFVFRQWHRHRIGWSYNELSARYKELPEEFYTPAPEHIGVQSKDNKQARVIEGALAGTPTQQLIADTIWSTTMNCFKQYRELLKQGCPRELARSVLPVNTYSHMFATCNLQSLFHFLSLRLHPHAQFEIQSYAQALLELASAVAPVAVQAFKTHQLGASTSGKST